MPIVTRYRVLKRTERTICWPLEIGAQEEQIVEVPSGKSFRRGRVELRLRAHPQAREKRHDNITYLDTPGSADEVPWKQATTAITERGGAWRLQSDLSLHARMGRVRTVDKTTMKPDLDSCPGMRRMQCDHQPEQRGVHGRHRQAAQPREAAKHFLENIEPAISHIYCIPETPRLTPVHTWEYPAHLPCKFRSIINLTTNKAEDIEISQYDALKTMLK